MRFIRELSRPTQFGLALTLGTVLVALCASFIVPYDPNQQDLSQRLAAPGAPGHFLGTDQYGRDLLSRLILGSRISLLVGVGAVALGAALGTILGLISGFGGRITDLVIGRMFDVLLSFPTILLALAVVAVLGPSLSNTILAIGITSAPTYGRIVRASVLSLRNRDFIHAARAMGSPSTRTLWCHVLPNVLSPLIIAATVGVAAAILVEATLSFLGLGTPPPTATWGAIISDGKQYLDSAPWISSLAGVAIVIAVMGITLVGDGLRDVLDPRLRR